MKNIKTVLLVSFIIAFGTYSFWNVLKNEYGIRIFYPGISLAFVGYTLVIFLLFKKLSKHENVGFGILVSEIICLTSLNSFIDELLFDPTKIQFNEYIGFILLILITYIQHGKRRKKGNG